MSSEKIQADYESLAKVAQRFTQRAQTTQQLYTAVNRQSRVLATTWEGKAAYAFQNEMRQSLFPALQRLIKALDQAGVTTQKISQVMLHAEEEAARLFQDRGTTGTLEATNGGSGGAGGGTSNTTPIRFKPAAQEQPPVLTRDEYTRLAMERAGINPAMWDPSQGFVHNQATIKAVYDYYRDVFLQDPNLIWAGMARVAGQQVFYPGFLQVNTLLQFAESPFAGILLPPGTGPLADLSAASLRFLETKFLDMQQQIFMDMAWQHEAYLNGGIDTMRQLAANGDLAADQLASWEKIASGDPVLIAQGNRELLRREQFDIIQDDYQQISQGLFRADGTLVSLGLSFVAISPMPGGEPFQEVVPGGNLANFDDRWQWIDNDMLPIWVNIAQNDPAQAQALANAPLNDSRVDAFADSAWGIVREEGENIIEGVENFIEGLNPFRGGSGGGERGFD